MVIEYAYRNQMKISLEKVKLRGLWSYLPNQTELGREYQCFYDNNKWWDQIDEDLEYRLYFSFHIRPSFHNRILIRFPKFLITTFNSETLTIGYYTFSKESICVIPSIDIEIEDKGKWIKVIDI